MWTAFDYETERGVAIADAEEDPAFVFRTGYWIKENMDVVNRFQFWDGEDILYTFAVFREKGWICTSGLPVRDEDGNMLYAVLTDMSLTRLLSGMKQLMPLAKTAIFANKNVLFANKRKNPVKNPANKKGGRLKCYAVIRSLKSL